MLLCVYVTLPNHVISQGKSVVLDSITEINISIMLH